VVGAPAPPGWGDSVLYPGKHARVVRGCDPPSGLAVVFRTSPDNSASSGSELW